MTREQQKQLKNLKQALPKMLKEAAGKRKIKKKDFMLYAVKGEMFFDAMIYVAVDNENNCHCSITESVKPLWLDELLWDLLDMKDNSKEPVSLRAIGAFTARGAMIHQRKTIMKEWNEDELQPIVDSYLELFCQHIEETTIENFLENIEKSEYQELEKALCFIHEGRYKEALDVVGEKEGCFKNGEIDIYDSIRAVCK